MDLYGGIAPSTLPPATNPPLPTPPTSDGSDGDHGSDSDSSHSPDSSRYQNTEERFLEQQALRDDKLVSILSYLTDNQRTESNSHSQVKTKLLPYRGSAGKNHEDLYAFLTDFDTHYGRCGLKERISKFSTFIEGPINFRTRVREMTDSFLRTYPSTWTWDKYCKMILETAVNGDPRLV